MATDAHFEVYPQHTDGIDPESGTPTRKATGQYGWRFQAANGQISAVSGEGFTRREDAHRAVRQFLTAASDVIEDLTAPVVTAPVLDVDE